MAQAAPLCVHLVRGKHWPNKTLLNYQLKNLKHWWVGLHLIKRQLRQKSWFWNSAVYSSSICLCIVRNRLNFGCENQFTDFLIRSRHRIRLVWKGVARENQLKHRMCPESHRQVVYLSEAKSAASESGNPHFDVSKGVVGCNRTLGCLLNLN